MGEIIGVIDADVVAQVAADDGAVIESDGSAQIMKFQVIRIQSAYTDQPEELTVLDKFGCKGIGYQYVVPVGGGVAIAYEHFYFIGCQPAIVVVLPFLEITQVIFVLSFGKIAAIDKVIPQGIDRALFDLIHGK